MRLNEARNQLAGIREERAKLKAEVASLLTKFRSTYPKGRLPLYLARAADHSRTPLRWRQRGSGKRLEITSQDGLEIIQSLPTLIIEDLFHYDRQRLRLNLALSTTSYEEERLADFVSASLLHARERKMLLSRN